MLGREAASGAFGTSSSRALFPALGRGGWARRVGEEKDIPDRAAMLERFER